VQRTFRLHFNAMQWMINTDGSVNYTANATTNIGALIQFYESVRTYSQLSTGARLSEALYLEWRDVDLTRSRVHFVPTNARGIKNGEARGVPLHPRVVSGSVRWRAAH
jgi:integrase